MMDFKKKQRVVIIAYAVTLLILIASLVLRMGFDLDIPANVLTVLGALGLIAVSLIKSKF